MLGKDSRKSHLFAASLLAAASVSCGKADSQGALPGYTKIDDMESQTGRIDWTFPGTLPGIWSSSTDCTQEDRIVPEPYFFNNDRTQWTDYVRVSDYETMPHVVSHYALFLGTNPNTQPLAGLWGANIGFDFADMPDTGIDAGSAVDGSACRQGSARDFSGVAVDLGAYCGLAFWAKAAASGRQAIRVQINDRQTDPRGGQCNSGDPSADAGNCYNGFGKDIMLTDAFTQYRVDFSDLHQAPSWGYRSVSGALDRANVYELNFEVELPSCATDPYANCAGDPAQVSFYIWIDDLYFVNCE